MKKILLKIIMITAGIVFAGLAVIYVSFLHCNNYWLKFEEFARKQNQEYPCQTERDCRVIQYDPPGRWGQVLAHNTKAEYNPDSDNRPPISCRIFSVSGPLVMHDYKAICESGRCQARKATDEERNQQLRKMFDLDKAISQF